MSEETFRASNNITIEEYSPGMLDLGETTLSEPAVQALREYFQSESDHGLGRWRDPKNPDWVVYPAVDDRVRVLNETTGEVDQWARWEIWLLAHTPENTTGCTFVGAARRYFEAHPEVASRPWENAQEGEIWALEHHEYPGTRAPYHVTIDTDGETSMGPRFFPANVGEWEPGLFPREFTAGTRIWPEPEGDSDSE